MDTPPRKELATLAGGCFWCLEAVSEQLKGVERVVVPKVSKFRKQYLAKLKA